MTADISHSTFLPAMLRIALQAGVIRHLNRPVVSLTELTLAAASVVMAKIAEITINFRATDTAGETRKSTKEPE